MREVSGSTWTFQIIILFILIFACFLTLVLTYNKAYTIKNRVVTIIEKYEGVTTDSGEIISNFMRDHSYKTTASCPLDEGWWGVDNIYGDVTYTKVENKNKYYYCFRQLDNLDDGKVYYEIQVFYKFNLPLIGEVATYRIKGQTKTFEGNMNAIY